MLTSITGCKDNIHKEKQIIKLSGSIKELLNEHAWTLKIKQYNGEFHSATNEFAARIIKELKDYTVSNEKPNDMLPL
jgi:hypothetical protein